MYPWHMMRFDHWGPGVQVLQTHISTVVLAGDFAYKFKKPVKLPFLDFSSAELRRRYCEEELRLNRRTAPSLYLDVVPVFGPLDAPVLDGSVNEPPADWALRMRRFPQEGLWSNLAQKGVLNASCVDALAGSVAAFHQSISPMPEGWAPKKGIETWTRESLDEIATAPLPAWLTQDRLRNLRSKVLARLGSMAEWRASRLDGGFVREGHGDMHLANIVEWKGKQMAYDAIEFEPDLRCIDVMHDAAFVFMDLLAHGLQSLALRFVNAYVEQTGDFDGLRGLHTYATSSALVRAKVALLSAAEPEVFERYWNLAENLITQPAQPALLLTMGLSGSGKSTLAQVLVEVLAAKGVHAVRVRSDVERKRLCGLPATARPGPELYTQALTARTYNKLSEVAQGLVRAGFVAVVDAAFLRHDEREQMRQLAIRTGAGFALLECVASPERMRERLLNREAEGQDASDATPEVLLRQMAFAEPMPQEWSEWHVRITNEASLDELQAQVQTWVGAWLKLQDCRF